MHVRVPLRSVAARLTCEAAALVVALLGTLTAIAFAQAPTAAGPTPYKPGVAAPLDYAGPGREDDEPHVAEVVIGWFGPGDPDHVEFGSMWRGALLAIEEENMAGGYRPTRVLPSASRTPVPFRLVPAWSETPWKAGVTDLLKVIYGNNAWAVIGGVDGTTTHLAAQLALKARFLLLSPGSTDVTADHGNVSWLFSLPPADTAMARVLAEAVTRHPGAPISVLASTDHTSHATLVALRRELDALHADLVRVVELDPAASGEADVDALLGGALKDPDGAVVIVAPVAMTATLVKQLRHAGYTGRVFGGAAAARGAFAAAAGAAANGVFAPCSAGHDASWSTFAVAYERRWHAQPDEAAADGYDAVRLVAAAVRQAGLNRARIRDAVRALAPFTGAAGKVRWDALGRNQRPVSLGEWREGIFTCPGASSAN